MSLVRHRQSRVSVHLKGCPTVTVAMRQMTSIVGGAGLALRVGRPGVIDLVRNARRNRSLPPLPAIADLYLIPVTLALVGRPLVVVPGVVFFCVSRALALF